MTEERDDFLTDRIRQSADDPQARASALERVYADLLKIALGAQTKT